MPRGKLSWYNHMKVTNEFFGQEKRCDVRTFGSYYRCSEKEGHYRSSEGGNYVKWFERFHLSRGDATVAMPKYCDHWDSNPGHLLGRQV